MVEHHSRNVTILMIPQRHFEKNYTEIFSADNQLFLNFSSFEHSFLGELRSGQKLIGLHNWISSRVANRSRHNLSENSVILFSHRNTSLSFYLSENLFY